MAADEAFVVRLGVSCESDLDLFDQTVDALGHIELWVERVALVVSAELRDDVDAALALL